MTMEKKEKRYIEALQELELDEDEALIYYVLLKKGKSGTIARKLNEELLSISRERIYSILRKLIERGFVIEGPPSEDTRKPKTFIASDPSKMLNRKMTKVEEKLNRLEAVQNEVLNDLLRFYNSGYIVVYDELHDLIKPVLKALLDKNWEVTNQIIKEGVNLFGGDLYLEYQLKPPILVYEKIDTIGLILEQYDTEIGEDELLLKFFKKQLKKAIREIHAEDFKNIEIKEGSIELMDKNIQSLLIQAKEKQSGVFHEFGETAILPLNNKIIFIWEEIQHEGKINREKQKKALEIIVTQIFTAFDRE
ncbi:MAG: hypothetical protein GF383_03880 [Candidatus Lokiarchaeota archaeon]|nr:hypothetical protein [Candidatus Lokiarchaeota archaeon]MBD3338844.1 hypothetical protein [Candidatus Lokiarchaeota archaeon]